MKKTLIGGLLAFVTSMASLSASAENILFGTGGPKQGPPARDIFTPWVEKVNAEAGDALNIKMRHGKMLVNPSNFIDRLKDDVVQITWGLPVFLPGNFPRSVVSTMPFMTESPAAAALAYCRMYEAGDFGTEWDDFVPLLFVPFPQVSVHLNGGPLESMEDIKGKKIATGSPIAAGIVKAYGGTPLSIQIPEQYQALQRGTADGTFMSYTAFRAFKLNEVTTDHLHAPLGAATGVAFMARKRFDALSPKAQEVLKANSGCGLAAKNGAIVDAWQVDGQEFTAKSGEHVFNDFDETALADLKERVFGDVIAGYDSRVPGGADLIAKWEAALKQAAIDAPEMLK